MQKNKNMLKIGLIGAGHLGKIHLRILKEITNVEFVGFYDNDKEISVAVSKEFDCKSYSSVDELLSEADAVDIVTPTQSHFYYAEKAIRQLKHVFIEKPITKTIKEAEDLIKLSEEAGVKVQVGHVERYNPAFISVQDVLDNPRFIEIHRLAEFNPRGTDVPVVLDLMIHDLDIVLSIIKSKVRKINANGVPVVSDTPDIANARVEFMNGAVANFTASRISLKNMRKSRFFQQHAYISVDFLEKKSEIVQIKNFDEKNSNPFAPTIDLGEKGKKEIIFDKPEIKENNAIKDELSDFVKSINENKQTIVTIEQATDALRLAQQILDIINEQLN